MILCQCKRVTDYQAREALRMGPHSVLDFQNQLGFAKGVDKKGQPACGSCMPNFVALFHAARQGAEQYAKALRNLPPVEK